MPKVIQSFITKGNNITESKLFPLTFIPLAISFLLAFSPSTSPLWFFVGEDSGVFKSFGQAIIQGKVIYKDIFDNKGPILYFINALGQWICMGKWGIFFIQTIFLSSSLYFIFRTARLFSNGIWSTGALLVTLFVYTVTIQDGNLCEEWMMYGFSVAIYLAVSWTIDLYKNSNEAIRKKRIRRDGLLYGFIAAYSFFIRPNDAVAIIGGILLGMIIVICLHRKWRVLLTIIPCVIMGFAIIAIPLLFYFSSKNALQDFWYGLVGLNISYSGGNSNIWRLIPPHKINILLYSIAISTLIYGTYYKKVLLIIAPPLFFELILMGDNMYLHYLTVLIPFFALAFGVAQQVPSSLAILGISILLIVPAPDTDGRLLARQARHMFTSKNPIIPLDQFQKQSFYDADKLVSMIPSKERNNVWNDLGGENSLVFYAIFPYNNIVPCNKDIFRFDTIQSWNIHIKQDLSTISPKPLWVLSSQRHGDPWLKDSLLSPYRLVGSTDVYLLFQKQK